MHGAKQRGTPADDWLDRRSGRGRVNATDGQYSDAIAKGHPVRLWTVEGSGAVNGLLQLTIRQLARIASTSSGNGTTIYGSSRASTTDFYPHHITAIATAVTAANSKIILAQASNSTKLLALTAAAPALLHTA